MVAPRLMALSDLGYGIMNIGGGGEEIVRHD
jgi:hypothetical protein